MKSVVAMVLAAAVSSAAIAQPASAPDPDVAASVTGVVDPVTTAEPAAVDAAPLAPEFTAVLATFVATDFTDSIGDLIRTFVAATAQPSHDHGSNPHD